MEMEPQQESKDEVGNLPFSPPPMKKSETRDSISSVDSDVSLSFDRRGSKSEEADLSDYDSEIRSVKGINMEQDSGADSVDDATLKNLENQKQSGIESESQLIEKTTNDLDSLNDELADKICAQVEFYFSDENIIKDAFLLKHVKRNKEGYVSLKLISSFKRVKHLSRDWRVVGTALARSKKLEVNAQGTKLRRVDPLPPFDQTAPSRTILAARLPIDKLTVESVAEIFKSCGEIALIRVLRPGQPTPSEVRQAISKRPELTSNEEYAMVEFTDTTSVRNAMQMTLGNAKVFELHQLADKKRKHQPTRKSVLNRIPRENNYNSSSCPSGSETEDGKTRHKKKNIQGYPTYHIYTSYSSQGPPSPDVWLSAQILVDVIPRVHLVPKQLSFIQVIRILSIIMKIAVTLVVLLQVLVQNAREIVISRTVVDRLTTDRFLEDCRYAVVILVMIRTSEDCLSVLRAQNKMDSIDREAIMVSQ